MTATQKPPLTFGSLFAGIGGFDLGFERAGMVCKWQVEIDDYATRVLEKHWPDVRRHRDVRTFPEGPADDWRVDVICGGFPCQDISHAGKGAGIQGERSGLWSEIVRIVRVLGPRFVVVENVAAITSRGLDSVCRDLAEVGFDAEWEVLSAKAFGSPQRGRTRLFLVAYPAKVFGDGGTDNEQRRRKCKSKIHESRNGRSAPIRYRSNWTNNQPGVLRMADGLSNWVDRLGCLGNAVVPQVAEWIGRRIVESYETG